MALLDKNGNLRGKVGNLNYRLLHGQAVAQTRPTTGMMKQSQGTKKSSTDFSVVSNRAKTLRTVLYPSIRELHDGKMINRLNAKLREVLQSNFAEPSGARDIVKGDLSLLAGFDFNSASPFSVFFKPEFKLSVDVSGLTVGLEEFNIKESVYFPDTANSCTLSLLVSAVNLNAGNFKYIGMKKLNITQRNKMLPAMTWRFNEGMPTDSLLLVSVVAEYFTEILREKVSLNTKTLNPVALLGVFPPQAFNPEVQVTASSEFWKHWYPVPG